jgi:valyl-tRNA synthetase
MNAADMAKKYDHKEVEPRIYKMWEEGGYFEAEIDPDKKPYTILLPPPNASGKMHTGNVLMIAVEDLLCRWKRMQGYSVLWVPGTDHAGFETQTTFERHLKKEGKSRFDFDRETLYKKIWDFVQMNKGLIEDQIRTMGASVDWSRYTFTLDDKSLGVVMSTFEKMYKEGLVYKGDYVVNYSFKWGTTFSDAEIQYKEQVDPLYYMKYGPFTLATVRPETKFGDTAVAVNPKDERYNDWIGKEIEVEGLLGTFKMKVIGDNYVDPEFGTGVVKVTPAHDKNDWEAGLRHNLDVVNVIGLDGRLNDKAGKYAGMKILEARKAVVQDLKEKGLIEKVDENYTHTVPVDYRSGDYIEMLVLPNWFINVEELKKPALAAIDNGELNVYPKWREVTYRRWVENMRDWAISRQVVWGIRIPVWYSVDENPDITVSFLHKGEVVTGKVGDLLKDFSFKDIEKGLQTLIASKDAKLVVQTEKPKGNYLQETDTFDTWFSSGQWPFSTLGYPDSKDFEYFYPTAVLETGWEIVTRWVSRMVMFGYYLTGKSPFKDVYLHGMVRALDGRKMSKSLGNVINPEEYAEEFGVDALRMGLISGTANGKDFSFPKDKVVAYRNFANKLWNMARFMLMMFEKEDIKEIPEFTDTLDLNKEDKEIIEGLKNTTKQVTESLEKYRFSDAGETLYHYVWDELADKYIEDVKNREGEAKKIGLTVLHHAFISSLKLLHPFMPFVTEEIWKVIANNKKEPLVSSDWPIA